METLFRILTVFTAVLVAYLVIAIQRHVPEINQNIAESSSAVAPLQEQLKQQGEEIDALQTQLTAFIKSENERRAKQERETLALRSIKKVIAKIWEADSLRKQGKLPEAADLLISTKDAIWKSGDFFTSEQKVLRSLMAPIDIVSGKWRGGNAQASATDIITQLQATLHRLGD
jgi:hypothetical protein